MIDRYEFDEHLPFYRYGDVCIWEIVVIVLIAVLFVVQSRPPRSG